MGLEGRIQGGGGGFGGQDPHPLLQDPQTSYKEGKNVAHMHANRPPLILKSLIHGPYLSEILYLPLRVSWAEESTCMLSTKTAMHSSVYDVYPSSCSS